MTGARMLSRGVTITLAVVLAAVAALPASADFDVRAIVEPQQDVTVDDTIQLTIQIEGDGPVGSLKPPRLPTLTNLRVVGGPSQHINTSWVNGRTRSTFQLRYALQAVRQGRVEIPPIEVEVGSTIHRTEAVTFDVAAARAGGPPSPGPGRGAGGTRDPRAGNVPRGADLFLQAEVPKTEVWVGESIPLTVTLYAAETVFGGSWREQPTFNGFWVEDLEIEPDSGRRMLRDGRPYLVEPIKRAVLVPQRPGRFEIEPFVLEAQVRRRGGDPFDSFFSFGRTDVVQRRTDPIVIEVRALPEPGKPDGFSGAVGSFELEAKIDRTSTAVNDAVAVTATVEGEGFLGAVTPPVLRAPPGVRVLDPEVRVASASRRGSLVSRKTWEWILVPTSPGTLELPALKFSFFDPEAGTYRTVDGALGTLVVERGAVSEDVDVARGEIALERRELQFIKPLRGSLRSDTLRAHERPLFFVLLLAPLLWVPGAVWLGRQRWHLQTDRKLARARKAGTRARKRLRQVERHLTSPDGDYDFHQEVARALVGYVADRFDRSAAGLTYEMADDLLASRGLDPELRRRFRSCLETCDFARFVPASAESGRKAEVLREANELVQSLERAS